MKQSDQIFFFVLLLLFYVDGICSFNFDFSSYDFDHRLLKSL